MKLFKLTVSACALAAAVSFTACDDSSSASDEGKVSYDCSVKDGVKVAYPKGGESFKIGDTITVVFGADVEDSGYRILLRRMKMMPVWICWMNPLILPIWMERPAMSRKSS